LGRDTTKISKKKKQRVVLKVMGGGCVLWGGKPTDYDKTRPKREWTEGEGGTSILSKAESEGTKRNNCRAQNRHEAEIIKMGTARKDQTEKKEGEKRPKQPRSARFTTVKRLPIKR